MDEDVYRVELKKDKTYGICSCGLSATMPYCDGSHKAYNAANGTNYRSMKILAEEDVVVNVKSSTWNNLA
jgi:CDGSH-type Zn-finger protein